jgi:hypothetical protein
VTPSTPPPDRENPSPVPLPQLRRVRWAVRGALTLGVAASVAANILHATRNPISESIAAWPPLALLITVELISRVPLDRRVLATARLIATTGIAGIAAYVSYWHMAGVAARYGEQGPSPYLLPLSVDGLIIVASVSLVELAGKIRTTETTNAPNPVPALDPGRAPLTTPARGADPAALPPPEHRENNSVAGPVDVDAHHQSRAGRATVRHHKSSPASTTPATDHPAGAPSGGSTLTASRPTPVRRPKPDAQPPAGSQTATAVAYWRNREPNLRPSDIAERIGKSERQVRRILATLETGDPHPGHTTEPALADSAP